MTVDMNFKFTYQGTPLDSTEAAALVTAVQGTKPLSIELGKLVDKRKLSSKTLFDLAVREAKPELANLAWKISVGKDSASPLRVLEDVKQAKPKPAAQINRLSQDAIIDKILCSKSYWAAGAALLISNLDTAGWTTMRNVATSFANHCYELNLVPTNSVLYRGFRKTKENEYEPIDLAKGVVRRESFHVSPIYIGLREALIFCQEQGLVETRSSVSTGYSTGEPSNQTGPGLLSRVFYEIRLSEKGEALQKTWEDAEDYAIAVFKSRSA